MTAHHLWLKAGARNVRETTTGVGRCGFLRRLPRPVDWLDLIACVVLVALVIAYEVT